MPLLRFLSILALLGSLGLNAQETPSFDRYLVQINEDVRLASVDYSLIDEAAAAAAAFESRLTEMSGRAANIGGHYFLGEIGCGTMCQTAILVNLETGIAIAQSTFGLGSCYQPDSNLLILNPYVSENFYEDEDIPDWLYTQYYLIEDDELRFLEKTKQSYAGECVSGQ